jgi:transcriptional regulator with XRE-family HTH domain
MGRAEPTVFISYNRTDESLANQVRRAILAQVARGGSYAELAQRSGVAKQQVGRFVRGERDMTLTSAGRVITALGASLTIPEDLRSVPEEELTPRDPRGGRPTRVGKSRESPAAKGPAGHGEGRSVVSSCALQEDRAAPRVETPPAAPSPEYREQLLHEAAHMALAYLMRREENIARVTIEEIRREMAANSFGARGGNR